MKSLNFESFSMEAPITCELANRDLWKSFDYFGNEMIITKVGRRIFPSIDITIENLDPNKYYGLCLNFTRTTGNRYKYTPKLGWTVGRPSDIPHVVSFYQHPESPALGSHWMSQTTVFDKVLFSNNLEVTQNIIILSSMHKYIPQIHIYEVSNSERAKFHISLNFPETSFVAVTAYQNTQITELKVQNNKYANGHRMKHDQDEAKRKGRRNGKSANLCKKLHEDDAEEDTTSSQDSEKTYESSHYSSYPCCNNNNNQTRMLPIRPAPMKPNVVSFGLIPYKLGYNDHNKKNLSKKEDHDVKSYTDFTITALLNWKTSYSPKMKMC